MHTKPLFCHLIACMRCRTQDGNTPLIVASKYGQTAVAELLLLGGADYFVRNNVRSPRLFNEFLTRILLSIFHAYCVFGYSFQIN